MIAVLNNIKLEVISEIEKEIDEDKKNLQLYKLIEGYNSLREEVIKISSEINKSNKFHGIE